MDDKRFLLRHFLAALAYRTQKALRGASSDFGAFSAAEGVRTPAELVRHMTSVLGYAELIRRRADDPASVQSSAAILVSEAERMAEIVRKIGKITKYETKPYVGDAHILDLNRATSHEE